MLVVGAAADSKINALIKRGLGHYVMIDPNPFLRQVPYCLLSAERGHHPVGLVLGRGDKMHKLSRFVRQVGF